MSDSLDDSETYDMACCSGEEDLVLKTGNVGEQLRESATKKETINTSSGDSGDTPVYVNNAIGNGQETGDTLLLKIPPANDVPDARPSADPSEVDAKPIG